MDIFRKRDVFVFIIIAIVLLVCGLRPKSYNPGKVVVFVEGRVVMAITKPGEYPVYKDGQRITTVVFDGRKVRVMDSQCPLKVCEKMGWVDPGGEIICVPNKLVVKFEGSTTDALTW